MESTGQGGSEHPWEDKEGTMRAEAGEEAAELSRGVLGSYVKDDRHKKPPKAQDLKSRMCTGPRGTHFQPPTRRCPAGMGAPHQH